MMPKCDLVLRETDVVCTVQTTVKCTIKLEDLVGINVVQKPHPLNSLACQMDIHSYPLVSVGLFGKTSRRLATTSFCFYQEPTFRENLYAAVQWKKAINKQCRRTMRKVFCCEESELEQTAEVAPLQLLVFINPFGGPGKAEQLFEEQVLPMFTMAEVQSTIVVTKRQNHARDVIKNYDFSTIDVIVVSSGDGLVFEVVNGIMERADWETAIRKPIGILPTGSGNGISASLLHESKEEYSLTNAAFLIIRGCPVPMDVATVETHDGGKCYMSLSMSWGMVADVDIESEKMRSLGETRFVLGSVKCIVKRNIYRGILHYLPLGEGHAPEAPGGGTTAAAMATECTQASTSCAPPSAAIDSQSAGIGQIKGTEGKDGMVPEEHSIGKQEDVDENHGLSVPQEHNAEKQARSSHDVQGNSSMHMDQTPGSDGSMEQNQCEKNSAEQSLDDKPSSQGNHTVTEQSRGGDSAIVTEQSQHCTGTHSGGAENGDVQTVEEQGLTRVPCGPHLKLLPHLSQDVPGSWKTLQVDLLSFSALLTSHISRSFIGDPAKRIGSGGLRVVLFRSEMSRFDLVRLLMDSESGKHLSREHVTVLEVSAFRLEVVTEPGMITVDGEAMPYGRLQVELHPRVARLMSRKRRQEGDTPT